MNEMDAQTGTAKTCECCEKRDATCKWLVHNAEQYYIYTCQKCGELLRTIRNSKKAECIPYHGVSPHKGTVADDPLDEVRQVYDEIAFANWRKGD